MKCVMCNESGKKTILSRLNPIETILIFFQQESSVPLDRFFAQWAAQATVEKLTRANFLGQAAVEGRRTFEAARGPGA
jgi:hypothetical protein